MPNFNAFKDCLFVQFSLNDNGTLKVPKNGIKELALYNNSKYIGETFIGVSNTSKFGIRILKNCTHWGIIDASDPETPVLIHVDEYPTNLPSVYRIRNHYMISRLKGNVYMSIVISDYKSHKDMKRKHESWYIMQITYSLPNSNITYVISGTAEELSPIVLDIINSSSAKIKPSVKPADTSTPHSSHNLYKDLRKEVIADFAKGMDRNELSKKYSISRTTINKWIRDANLSTYKKRKNTSNTTSSTTNLHRRIESISIKWWLDACPLKDNFISFNNFYNLPPIL